MPAQILEKTPDFEEALHDLSKFRATVRDAVDEGVRSAARALRHGRYAAEEAIEEAEHTVKQRPLQSIAIAFAAGLLAGGIVTLIGLRRD